MCYSMRRNKESDIEKERKAPDNSFRNNRRKAPANKTHSKCGSHLCRTTAIRPFILEAKVKKSIQISGVSQRYQLLNFIWDASTASGKNGGMTYDVTEHFWRKLI